jgi:hypothetical protein
VGRGKRFAIPPRLTRIDIGAVGYNRDGPKSMVSSSDIRARRSSQPLAICCGIPPRAGCVPCQSGLWAAARVAGSIDARKTDPGHVLIERGRCDPGMINRKVAEAPDHSRSERDSSQLLLAIGGVDPQSGTSPQRLVDGDADPPLHTDVGRDPLGARRRRPLARRHRLTPEAMA